ncbi:MAG: hypothetical protein ACLPUO_00580 [Streptosporangiaceae bacterium]|jgi:hypothetical protein
MLVFYEGVLPLVIGCAVRGRPHGAAAGSCSMKICIPVPELRKILGPPAATYLVDGYQVLVWRQNLLSHRHPLYWCGNVWPWVTQVPPSNTPCR